MLFSGALHIFKGSVAAFAAREEMQLCWSDLHPDRVQLFTHVWTLVSNKETNVHKQTYFYTEVFPRESSIVRLAVANRFAEHVRLS